MDEYRLKRWNLQNTSDGIVLEGALCGGRPDMAGGHRIQTSRLRSFAFHGTSLIASTENSLYRCSLADYLFESNSIYLLDWIDEDAALLLTSSEKASGVIN